MNVYLTPELKKLVEDRVSSGRYSSASEVIRAGLRLLEEEDDWRAEVRSKIEVGLVQLEDGKVVDGEEAIARIDARLAALEKQTDHE